MVISFLGFLDATYLTVSHYQGADLNCNILEGCDEVTTSKYSTIFGIPVALFGMGYYLSIMLLSLLFIDTKNGKILKVLPYLTIVGLLASIWFVYLQIFVIEAICIYCMGSATTSTLIFILGIILLTKEKNESKP